MEAYLVGLFFAGIISLIYGYRWGKRSINNEIFEKAKQEYIELFEKNVNSSMDAVLDRVDKNLKKELEQLYQERNELLDKLEKMNKEKEKNK